MYDDAKFGVVQRTWFGLHDKLGGGYTAAIEHAGSATTKTLLKRWYPKGPINVKKIGFMVVATASAADNASGASNRARIPVEFYKSSSKGTTRTTMLGSIPIKLHPTANIKPLWAIGSKEAINTDVESGRFITIFAATSESNEGTQVAARGSTCTGGSWAFFIDWVPIYDAGGNWDS